MEASKPFSNYIGMYIGRMRFRDKNAMTVRTGRTDDTDSDSKCLGKLALEGKQTIVSAVYSDSRKRPNPFFSSVVTAQWSMDPVKLQPHPVKPATNANFSLRSISTQLSVFRGSIS